MKLNHLDLTVLDVPRAVQFFETYFEFELRSNRASPAIAIMNDGHGFVLVLQRSKLGHVEYPEGSHIGFLVEDVALVHAFHTRAKRDGLQVSDVETNNRGTMIYCRAPDGFLVEVSCHRDRS